MLHKTLFATLIVCALTAPAAMAQGTSINVGSTGITTSLPTSVGGVVNSILNTVMPNQSTGGMVNGLPATSMDSFVYQAGGSAELIYGDEGTDDIPPYFEFTKDHRINAGIFGQRSAGLTTGHGSYLPDAWGGDEWVKGPEFDQSGANSIPVGGTGTDPTSDPGSGINLSAGGVNINAGGVNINANGNGISGSVSTPIGNVSGSVGAGVFGF